jgi:hypothetical protein
LCLWIEELKPPQGDIFVPTFAKNFPKNIHFRNELVSYEALKSIDFYDANLTLYEDYDIRIRLTKKYRAVFNNEVCSEYRRHSTGLSCSEERHIHLKDLNYLYQKNKLLLNDLDAREKKYVQIQVNRYIARIIRGHSAILIEKDHSNKYNRIKAVCLYLKSLKYSRGILDINSLAKVVLPKMIYRFVEKIYAKIFKTNIISKRI